MRLDRLRIVGFKTFVEPTDVPILDGLTGIVGPNGCGKSNLVEALRWVMGESSHKNMRAAGMDEVIFAGSTTRPARNTAEVRLALDNSDRRAPAAFNDAETLEVSRRIEREQGSSYQVNGREVRARDVQLLFADAASGARSPSLVRQGQIGELIAAKPQARRRILEDAAGIAGLHARRHEAELRLKATEDNLLRVEDVLREIGAQADGLRRQGRQAQRYKALSAEIRTLEARLQALAYRIAAADLAQAEADATADTNQVGERAAAQAEAARRQAIAQHELGPLREGEAAAASRLRRLVAERANLDGEERRARERLAELERRLVEIGRDAERQAGAQADAADTIARLERDLAALAQAPADGEARRVALDAARSTADAALAAAEGALDAAQAEASRAAASRQSLEATRRQEGERAQRLRVEAETVRRDLAAFGESHAAATDAPEAALAAAEQAALAADATALASRAAIAPRRDEEARLRATATEADRGAGRLETELRTLTRLFAAPAGRWSQALDAIETASGYEIALGAALGDDLEASTDPGAPVAWGGTGPGEADPALPPGAEPLSLRVSAPVALQRRLAQIGVVAREDGPLLARRLRPGQRLVSRDGDLWRWDGFRAAAEAPSAAARRLSERRRINDLAKSATASRAAADGARDAARAAESALKDATGHETAAAEEARRARAARDGARDRLAGAQRDALQRTARVSALREAAGRIAAGESEAASRVAEAERALAALPDAAEGEIALAQARGAAAERRAVASDARAALAAFLREAEQSAARRGALAADIQSWTSRAERAATAAAELVQRRDASRRERDELAAAPDAFVLRRRALSTAIDGAEVARRAAADRLALAETALASADREARTTLDALAAARERRAGSAARAEAAAARLDALTRQIADTLAMSAAELMTLAGFGGVMDTAPLPDAAGIETRLAVLKVERERLGGVNLRAEEELAETEAKEGDLARERDDLAEALRRLRGAVGVLNREGRERLLAAFSVVNEHFARLFTSLFGGGTADLTLVDSDDPLEAGLEIMARPPGKKPTSLSLLSGGEQALTATALIFAVFLTNPSPICVLDEVDAPLDDANVERYCDLLHDMAGETETRFLVITHNPITMARMDRLFGVTMAERGVSQLVSVDLEQAEGMREAG